MVLSFQLIDGLILNKIGSIVQKIVQKIDNEHVGVCNMYTINVNFSIHVHHISTHVDMEKCTLTSMKPNIPQIRLQNQY